MYTYTMHVYIYLAIQCLMYIYYVNLYDLIQFLCLANTKCAERLGDLQQQLAASETSRRRLHNLVCICICTHVCVYVCVSSGNILTMIRRYVSVCPHVRECVYGHEQMRVSFCLGQ